MNLFASPWNAAFFVGLVVYTAIRGVWIERTKGDAPELRRIEGMERVSLALVFLGALLAPVVYLVTPLLDFASYPARDEASWIGLVLLLGALWLFARSHSDLGRNWSVSVDLRREHELVTRGVYARMRHPMYTAILLFDLAQLLMLPNAVAGPAALLTFLPLVLDRAPKEERLLRQRFGAEYDAYCRRTWRYVPRPAWLARA